jgi:hypothetical protein
MNDAIGFALMHAGHRVEARLEEALAGVKLSGAKHAALSVYREPPPVPRRCKGAHLRVRALNLRIDFRAIVNSPDPCASGAAATIGST